MKKRTKLFLLICCSSLIFLAHKCPPYQKMKPPPDVDKPVPIADNDNSCWMATAANMLAGAGYGNGATVQQRAADVFADMAAEFGISDRGWPDTALQWWLNSSNNTWPTNHYTLVTVLGTKSMLPWDDSNIPRTIGNELRKCQFVGLGFSWPTNAPGTVGYGGHATTAWGDNFGESNLTHNPKKIHMSDSDRDTEGDIQIYKYDSYNHPNPGGPNEGNGCYFNFGPNHPYIRCIFTLCPTQYTASSRYSQKVVGSYKIHQNNRIDATNLHYRVGSDTKILNYLTTIDWTSDISPAITESQPQRAEITVDWNLTNKKVPLCNWVTINTEFVLPNWNSIQYRDVHFTCPGIEPSHWIPDLRWELKTPNINRAETIPDVTGGYVIGGFEILPAGSDAIIAQYRFIHQYGFNQTPEQHIFVLEGQPRYRAQNLRFGHNYAYINPKDLWKFEQWMSNLRGPIDLGQKYEYRIDWAGKLPYPKGIDVKEAIKDIRETPKIKKKKQLISRSN